jgi:hypothetical protein
MNYEAQLTLSTIESEANPEVVYYPSFFAAGMENWQEDIGAIQQASATTFALSPEYFRKAGITEGMFVLAFIFNYEEINAKDITKHDIFGIKKLLFEAIHKMRKANLNDKDRELLADLIPAGEKTLEEYERPFVLDLSDPLIKINLVEYARTRTGCQDFEQGNSNLDTIQLRNFKEMPTRQAMLFIDTFYREHYPEDIKDFDAITNIKEFDFAKAFVDNCFFVIAENRSTIDSNELKYTVSRLKQSYDESVFINQTNFENRDSHLQKYFGKNYTLTEFKPKTVKKDTTIDALVNNPIKTPTQAEFLNAERTIPEGYFDLSTFPTKEANELEKRRKNASTERIKLLCEVATTELEIAYFIKYAPDSIKRYSTSWNSISNIKDLNRCMKFFNACEVLSGERLRTNQVVNMEYILDQMNKINILIYEGNDCTERFDSLYSYVIDQIDEGYLHQKSSIAEYQRIIDLLPPYSNDDIKNLLEKDRERMNDIRDKIIDDFVDFHELTKGYEQNEAVVKTVIDDVIYNDLNVLDRNNPFTYFQEVFQGKIKSNNETKRVIYLIKEGVKKYFESRVTEGLSPAQLEKLKELQKISKEDFQKATEQAHKILNQHTGFVIEFKDPVLKLILASVLFNDQFQIVQDLLDKRDNQIEAKLTRLLKEVEALDPEFIKTVRRQRVEFRPENADLLKIEDLGDNYIQVEQKGSFWGEDSTTEQAKTLRRQYRTKTKTVFESEKLNANEYIDSVRYEIMHQKIPVKEITYKSDGTVVFLMKDLAIIAQKGKETQAIFQEGFNIEEMEMLSADFEGKFNKDTIQEFCFYNGYRYFSLKHKGQTNADGSHTDYNWKKEQADLINNPKTFKGWKINMPKEYSRETMKELTGLGLNFWGISALGNLIRQYEKSSQVDLSIDKPITTNRVQEIHDAITFKVQVDADTKQKVDAPQTLFGLISDPKNTELSKNLFVADYVDNLSRYYDWVDRLSDFYEAYKTIGIPDNDRELYQSLKTKMASLGKVFGRDSAYFTEKSFVFGGIVYGKHTPLTEYIDTLESATTASLQIASRLAKLSKNN